MPNDMATVIKTDNIWYKCWLKYVAFDVGTETHGSVGVRAEDNDNTWSEAIGGLLQPQESMQRIQVISTSFPYIF